MRSSWSSLGVPFALCALVALAPSTAARALKAPAGLGQLEEADHKALETIASHDAPLRDAVLKASLHIDELVETQRIQEQSSASFQDRIAKLDKKQQEQVWEIVREPGLIDELATEDPPSRSELEEIVGRHPESLAPAIREFGGKRHDLIVDISQIHRRANERFDAALSDLDADTQQAFRDLVEQPELMSVLVRRVNLVVRLGDSYRKHPKDTRSYLTALAADVEQRTAADREEWKKRIESDPKAAEELDEAARDYAEEHGYDYEELTSPEVRTRVDVVVHPYPYWYGYPVWYSDAYLYPYGYWYPYPIYFGYYHYHNHFYWYGLPSLAFMHWFYFGHHHHHYIYLSNCFTHYYHGRRYAPTYYNVTVNNFIRRSDPVDRHRADWSSRGDGSRDTRRASYAGRDRGFFFNRHQGKQGVGRRTAPGERGVAMDPARGGVERAKGRGQEGRGEIRPQRPGAKSDAGVAPGEARGRERARSAQPSHRREEPRIIQRSNPQAKREAAPAEPRRREREWPHAPRVIREEPRVEPSAPSGGAEPRGHERRSSERPRADRGAEAPVVRGDDGGGPGHGGGAPSGRGEGSRGGSSGGGERGGSRGRGWGGGDSGGGWGGSRGGDFGGGFGGGGFDGGGSRGGSRGR